MSNFATFNINGIDASINLASETEHGLMSSVNYNQLETLEYDVDKLELFQKIYTESIQCILDENATLSLADIYYSTSKSVME